MEELYNIAKSCKTYKEFDRAINDKKPKKKNHKLAIVNGILKLSKLTFKDVRSQKRKRELVDVRMIMSVALLDKGYHPKIIGKYINRDRSTVLHHKKIVSNLLETNKEFKEKYNLLTKLN